MKVNYFRSCKEGYIMEALGSIPIATEHKELKLFSFSPTLYRYPWIQTTNTTEKIIEENFGKLCSSLVLTFIRQ